MKDWKAQISNCLKRPLPNVFLEISWNFSKRFSKHPLKNAWSDFFVRILRFLINLVTLIKLLHYRSFLSVFPAISEHWQETFFLEYVLFKPEILNCSVREEETVLQRCFGIFEILEHHFPSEHFQKSIYNGGFISRVGCRLKSFSFIKWKLHMFFWIFSLGFSASISKYCCEIICDGA